MHENYFLTVCSLGVSPNLTECLRRLLEIKSHFDLKIEVLLVINNDLCKQNIPDGVIVKYEKMKGYSNARNAALSSIFDNSNLIFIDDDELPTLSWFMAIASTHEKYPTDIIVGPVYSSQKSSVHSYRNKFEKFFKNLPDEAVVSQAGAGNMLIPSNLIQTGKVYFDPVFNLSGSEDTDFCFRMRKQGRFIRYSKNAEIYEVQAPNRADVEYLEFRYIRDVSNYSVVIRRNCGVIAISYRFFTLLAQIFIHCLLLMLSL